MIRVVPALPAKKHPASQHVSPNRPNSSSWLWERHLMQNAHHELYELRISICYMCRLRAMHWNWSYNIKLKYYTIPSVHQDCWPWEWGKAHPNRYSSTFPWFGMLPSPVVLPDDPDISRCCQATSHGPSATFESLEPSFVSVGPGGMWALSWADRSTHNMDQWIWWQFQSHLRNINTSPIWLGRNISN
jgi:hypothetical protein